MEDNQTNPRSATQILISGITKLAKSAGSIRNLLIVFIVISLLNMAVTLIILVLNGNNSEPNQETQQQVANTYEYHYEVLSTRMSCIPDELTWAKLNLQLLSATGMLGDEEIQEENQKATSDILQCINQEVETHILQLGDEGWEIISFEAIQPSQYDNGFEFYYRFLLKKDG